MVGASPTLQIRSVHLAHVSIYNLTPLVYCTVRSMPGTLDPKSDYHVGTAHNSEALWPAV